MAIAHVCIQCGFDLARTRPAREPHYGLMLVVCPRCHHACVRRRHPIWTAWRTIRRFDFVLRVMSFKVAITSLLCALTAIAVISILLMGFRYSRVSALAADDFAWLCVWVFGILAPATGAWLTAAFSHLKRSHVWLGWTALMSIPLLGIVVISLMVGELPPGFGDMAAGPSVLEIAKLGLLLLVLPGMMVVLVMMIAACAGIPIGKMLLWLTSMLQRWMWHSQRRRRKLRRAL
jgi:hypothetical protein